MDGHRTSGHPDGDAVWHGILRRTHAERGMNMSDELAGSEENDTVTLTLDDDTEIVCDVITIFSCGDKQYIALLPQDSEDDGEVYLYEFQENGDEPNLINIESDEEFEAVSDAFEEWLDSEEFDEMFGDDEDGED